MQDGGDLERDPCDLARRERLGMLEAVPVPPAQDVARTIIWYPAIGTSLSFSG
jgi:hypothetical protein